MNTHPVYEDTRIVHDHNLTAQQQRPGVAEIE